MEQIECGNASGISLPEAFLYSLLTPTQVLRRLIVVEDVNQQAPAVFYNADVTVEAGVRDGVQADDIETDALIIPGNHIGEDLVIQAGIVAEVGVRAPSGVPPGVEQQEVRLRRTSRRSFRPRRGAWLHQRAQS